MIEPIVSINGVSLTESQARIVRTAVATFAANVKVVDIGNGSPRAQWLDYKKQIQEVLRLIDSPPVQPL